MKKILSHKYSKFIFKVLILLFAYGYIYFRMEEYKSLHFVFTAEKFIFLILALALMFINWSIETLKWQFLISKIENIKLITAFKAVFSGITFSIFTPNRLGELAGRVFVFKQENRIKAGFSTFISGLAQLFITVTLGVISSINLISFFPEKFSSFNKNYTHEIIILLTVIFFLNFFFYLKIKSVANFLLRFKIFKAIEKYLSVLKLYSTKDLIIALTYSLLRYFVFFMQFYLLLLFFQTDISLFQAFTGVSLMYLAMSAIPTFAITEIGVRGSTAIFFIGLFSSQTSAILGASIFLWIINLAIPSIIGSIIFYKTKI